LIARASLVKKASLGVFGANDGNRSSFGGIEIHGKAAISAFGVFGPINFANDAVNGIDGDLRGV
jgi:hypothetical protein